MDTVPTEPSTKTGTLAMFFGIWGLIVLATMLALDVPFWFIWLPLLAAVLGLPIGMTRLARQPNSRWLTLKALVPAVLLSPPGFFLCLALLFATPMVFSSFQYMLRGQNIVKQAVSPDGQYKAYVVDQPSIDPPNQDLYIQRGDGRQFLFIAHLPEDIDGIREIHWSPDSRLVVFQTRYTLTAVRLPGYVTVQIPFAEWRRDRPTGGKLGVCGMGIQAVVVEFPQPGVFAFRANEDAELTVVDMNGLQPRREVLAVSRRLEQAGVN